MPFDEHKQVHLMRPWAIHKLEVNWKTKDADFKAPLRQLFFIFRLSHKPLFIAGGSRKSVSSWHFD